ncbi:MAG: type II secretion system major pseudopilin GspG [Candidatus Omnitrophica bacterium]|nr:type II secretion system major pseudopilin GspG [Candidatus Omnitrophota bacterium]
MRCGFTLVELMIVVIIIAAMAAMVVPRLAGRSEQARVSVAQADISSNISMALKLYELDNGNYPTSGQGLNALLSTPSSSPAPPNWNGPYLERKPVDPWGNLYQYKCPGVHNQAGYDLYSVGKDGLEGTNDDVGNWQ